MKRQMLFNTGLGIMKALIEHVAPFDRAQKVWNVIVETSKGSRLKYAYDPAAGLLTLKQALPEGMVFPFNFGFVPGTQGDDGDPLDILILNQLPVDPLTLVKVKLVGVIEAEQTEGNKTERNDRIVGVAITPQAPASPRTQNSTKNSFRKSRTSSSPTTNSRAKNSK